MQFASNVEAFFKNVKLTKNSAITGSGGALFLYGANLTFETAEFAENTAAKSGGAIRIDGTASVTLYDITANKNSAGTSGGFMHNTDGAIKIYDSSFTENTSVGNGGAITADTDSLLCYRYYNSEICKESPTRDGHIESGWIIDREYTDTLSGIKHKECTRCAKILSVSDHRIGTHYINEYAFEDAIGYKLKDAADAIDIGTTLNSAPLTFEATFKLPSTFSSVNRGGVILGNYDGSNKDGINVEIYTNGRPRLYYKVGSIGYSYVFKTDIRSDNITRLAITIDGIVAKLYINGELKETTELTVGIPKPTSGFFIGNDRRTDSSMYFKGELYSINLFSDIRTAEEIFMDSIAVTDDTQGLIYSKNFMSK